MTFKEERNWVRICSINEISKFRYFINYSLMYIISRHEQFFLQRNYTLSYFFKVFPFLHPIITLPLIFHFTTGNLTRNESWSRLNSRFVCSRLRIIFFTGYPGWICIIHLEFPGGEPAVAVIGRGDGVRPHPDSTPLLFIGSRSSRPSF